MTEERSRLRAFLEELKRRRVVRVAAIYAASAFVIVQVADLVLPALLLPPWAFTLVVVLTILGFLIAVALAWAYDATPEGLVLTGARDADHGSRTAHRELVARASLATAPATPDASRASGRSIAVLPFVDMSPARDQEYFSDGITEEILNVLSRAEDLRVSARTSSFAFKGKDMDVREVGAHLGVTTVLEGSVRKAGNRLRITAQLIDVADGFHLWSESYDREMEDVFEIQDEIARSIGAALQVELGDEQLREVDKVVPTKDVRAYDYYLRGRQFFYHQRRRSFDFARQMFERAIEIDPGYALAYAGLALCHADLYLYWDNVESHRTGAEEASQRSVELAPDLAEAHVARGVALALDRPDAAATAELETAIRLDPKLFEAHYFHARTLLAQGRLEEAAAAFERASRVRPEDYQSPALVIGVYTALGRTAEARSAARRAVDASERHLELNPDDARAANMGGRAWIELGERQRALEWAARALRLDPTDPVICYNAACTYSLLGETEPALESLERAVANGFVHLQWIEHDSDLDGIRGDPRFEALIARLLRGRTG